MEVETASGTKLALSSGGTRLAIDGEVVVDVVVGGRVNVVPRARGTGIDTSGPTRGRRFATGDQLS